MPVSVTPSRDSRAPSPADLLAAQGEIATHLAASPPPEDLCDLVLGTLCATLGHQGGDAWLRTADGGRRTVAVRGTRGDPGRAVALTAGADGVPIGGLRLFGPPADGADDALTAWLAGVGAQVGRAIRARRSRDAEIAGAEGRLARAEARHRTLVENIPTVTYIAEWDEHSSITYVSPQIGRISGYPPEQWLGASDIWEHVLHPDDRSRAIAEAKRSYHQEREFDCEYRFVAADGRTVWIWERDTIIRDDDGGPLYSQGVMMDITRLREAEAAQRASEELHRRSIAALHEGVFVHGSDGRIAACNASACELLGLPEHEVVGKGPGGTEFSFFQEDGAPLTAESSPTMRVLASGRPVTGVVLRLQRPDGDERWVSLNSQPLFADGGTEPTGVVSTMADITERRRAQEEVAYLAYHDALTGLPNRTLLAEHLELGIARARRNGTSIAVLYIDLDDFKLVNDSLGHQRRRRGPHPRGHPAAREPARVRPARPSGRGRVPRPDHRHPR